MEHRLSCPVACGIFLDQGWNLCSLHWQVDSYPPDHQVSSTFDTYYLLFTSFHWPWVSISWKPSCLPYIVIVSSKWDNTHENSLETVYVVKTHSSFSAHFPSNGQNRCLQRWRPVTHIPSIPAGRVPCHTGSRPACDTINQENMGEVTGPIPAPRGHRHPPLSSAYALVGALCGVWRSGHLHTCTKRGVGEWLPHLLAEPQLPIVPSEASRARTTLLGATDLDLSSHRGPSILPLWTGFLPSTWGWRGPVLPGSANRNWEWWCWISGSRRLGWAWATMVHRDCQELMAQCRWPSAPGIRAAAWQAEACHLLTWGEAESLQKEQVKSWEEGAMGRIMRGLCVHS